MLTILNSYNSNGTTIIPYGGPMQNPDLINQMQEKAEAVQAIVSKVVSIKDAFQYAVDLTKAQGGQTVAATGLAARERDLLRKQCETADLMLLDFPLRPHAVKIHTALTPVDWGIAETGTLVLDSTSEDIRIATMLAETHIAFLPASRIKPDSVSVANELNAVLKTDAPVYYAFITGASRTADIERVLAVGVHGPKELHILIVEENNA
jgi:L-lactate dehydrogenase complex protein LldG